MENVKLLHKNIKDAQSTTATADLAKLALYCLDLTLLSGTETLGDIKVLCEKAKNGDVGGVCVYPNMVRSVADFVRSKNIAVTTVINFPYGDKTNDGGIATPENTAYAVREAIANGATEIDIVIDYKNFTEENARALLYACKDACGTAAKMKVILEIDDGLPDDWIARCEIATQCGANMLKTSTGKYPESISDHDKMEAVSIMMHHIKNHNGGHDVGLNVSGGISINNFHHYMGFVTNEMGANFINPVDFRFGASGVYDDLIAMGTKTIHYAYKPHPLWHTNRHG